jgi:phosphatidylglycerol:prolipoprotein diacylglycerol transferase
MHPILFKLGPFELHAYGAMLALSFFLGIMLASRRAPARGVSPDFIVDVSFAIVLASVVGSRLMYAVFHLEEMHSIIDVIAVWKGGMTMYGGVLAAMGMSWVYARRKGIPFLRLADIMSPSLAMGLLVTRVGCFLNGCCYGKPTDSFLGVTFPFQTAVGAGFDSPIHPTQLYSSITGLIVLVLLLLLDRRVRPEGQLFGFYLIFAGLGRFSIDALRYYEANAYVIGSFTVSQLISVGLMLTGAAVLLRVRRAPAAPRVAITKHDTNKKLPASHTVS